jgi:putative endonuclease
MAYVYVLYSGSRNRFYTGVTRESPNLRLQQHNNSVFGPDHFTASGAHWILFLEIKCNNLNQALAIEKHIKRMKSAKYIRNLKMPSELSDKLLERYSS